MKHHIRLKNLDGYIRRVDRRVDSIFWVMRQDDPRHRIQESPAISILMQLVMDFDNLKQSQYTAEDRDILSLALHKYGINCLEPLPLKTIMKEYVNNVKLSDDEINRLNLIMDVTKVNKWPAWEVSPIIVGMSLIQIARSLQSSIEMQLGKSFTFLSNIGIEIEKKELTWLDFAFELIYRIAEVRLQPEIVSDPSPPASDDVYFLFDVSGANTVCGMWRQDTNELSVRRTTTAELWGNKDQLLQVMREFLLKEFGVNTFNNKTHFVFSMSGIIDEHLGVNISGGTLGSYRGFNVRECFANLSVPAENIHVLNDAKAAGLGCSVIGKELRFPCLVIILSYSCPMHELTNNAKIPIKNQMKNNEIKKRKLNLGFCEQSSQI